MSLEKQTLLGERHHTNLDGFGTNCLVGSSYEMQHRTKVEGIVLNSFSGCADTGIEDNSRHDEWHRFSAGGI